MTRFSMKLLIIAVNVMGVNVPATTHCSGRWANAGQPPVPHDSNTGLQPTKAVVKPDILVKDNRLYLHYRDAGLHPLNIPDTPGLTEVLWSGDGKRVALNWSDGGVVGSWNSSIVVIDGVSKPVLQELPADIVAKANKLPQCEEVESANLGVVAWPQNGKQLLLVAEVPPHSSCQNMGSIQGFLLDSQTGKLVATFSEAKLKADWRAYLGCRFQR